MSPSQGQPSSEVRVHVGAEAPRPEPAPCWAAPLQEYAALAALAYPAAPGIAVPEGWAKVEAETVDDPKSSLYFEVWRKEGAPPQVAFVFRGTQEAKDWWSNARWLTRFLTAGSDQYDLVRVLVGGLVARAKARDPQATFVAVGHSLGGGLAQQAAYAQLDIRTVYAFDPSPVTGFRSVAKPTREANSQGLTIVRAFEHGEILAYVRYVLKIARALSEANPKIIEVRFNLSQGATWAGNMLQRIRRATPGVVPFIRDGIDQHSMTELAKAIAASAQGKDGAACEGKGPGAVGGVGPA
ncbi:MAG: hypothetical protein HYZ13_07275 [Acidobacteria bacterium]|nr:hypothetical protein [Acidobacteriota bacterium]